MYAYLWTQNASLDILNNQSIFFLYYFLLKNHFTKVCKRKINLKKIRARKKSSSQPSRVAQPVPSFKPTESTTRTTQQTLIFCNLAANPLLFFFQHESPFRSRSQFPSREQEAFLARSCSPADAPIDQNALPPLLSRPSAGSWT
jgi:hypothetical protein